MLSFLPTIILRHRKENKKKCSLTGLETRSDLNFLPYPRSTLPSLEGYVHLSLDAPPLTEADALSGLLLLDATWRYEQGMRALVPDTVCARSIPNTFVTAYPRKQTGCTDPERGLATVEALYIAYTLLGRDTRGLLDKYYWGDAFLEKNLTAFAELTRAQKPEC